MKKNITLSFVIVSFSYANAQTILNGGFEDTDGSFAGTNGIMYSSLAPSWSKGAVADENTSPDWINEGSHSGGFSPNGTEGSYFQVIDAYANGAYTSVRQTVSGFTGGSYRLSFDHANFLADQGGGRIHNTVGGFRVLLDGVQVGAFTSMNSTIRDIATESLMPDVDWQTSTLNISPTAGSHVVELAAFYTSGTNAGKLFSTQLLDNVRLAAVPEPSSSALLGLCGLTLLFRRCR